MRVCDYDMAFDLFYLWFDEPCAHCYDDNKNLKEVYRFVERAPCNQGHRRLGISILYAPYLHQVNDWFIGSFGVFVSVVPGYDGWRFCVYEFGDEWVATDISYGGYLSFDKALNTGVEIVVRSLRPYKDNKRRDYIY